MQYDARSHYKIIKNLSSQKKTIKFITNKKLLIPPRPQSHAHTALQKTLNDTTKLIKYKQKYTIQLPGKRNYKKPKKNHCFFKFRTNKKLSPTHIQETTNFLVRRARKNETTKPII